MPPFQGGPGHDQRPGYPQSPGNQGAASQRGAGGYPGAGSHQRPGARSDTNPYPGPYPGPEAYEQGYGEPVNGGSYAYVIREEGQSAPRSPRTPQAPQMPQAPRQHQAPAPDGRPRAARPPADPGVAYGPDDPAYGPPGPEWYAREEAARRQEIEEENQHARGPFEPLPPDHVVPEPPVFDSYEDEVGSAAPRGYQYQDFPAEAAVSEADREVDITLAGQGDGPPLERIKDLYMTAETIGDSRLDEHFEQLLDKQRQLIREYFTESGSRKPASFDSAGDRAGDSAPERPERPGGPGHPGGPASPDRPEDAGLSLGGMPRSWR